MPVDHRFLPEEWRGWSLKETGIGDIEAAFLYHNDDLDNEIHLLAEARENVSYITVFADDITQNDRVEIFALENKLMVEGGIYAEYFEYVLGGEEEARIYANL